MDKLGWLVTLDRGRSYFDESVTWSIPLAKTQSLGTAYYKEG